MGNRKLLTKLRQDVAGLTLLELMHHLEFQGWAYKLRSYPLANGARQYVATVFATDALGGGNKVRVPGDPVDALTEAYVNCVSHRLGQARRLGAPFAVALNPNLPPSEESHE